MKPARAELRHCILRARLMDELCREGVQVALPANLSGIDLLAYTAPLNNIDGLDDCSQASVLRRVLEPYAMTSGGWRSKISRWIRERECSSTALEGHKRALS
jgi:hypothetical protein